MPWVLPGCWIASNLDNMNNQSALTESVSKNNDQKQVKAKQIFLGIDAQLARNQVARKIDNSGIQGVQSLSAEELLLFAQKQLRLAEEVYAVYEAGPLGYVLYRRLRELGIKALVCAPECLEQGKRKAQQAGRPQADQPAVQLRTGRFGDAAGGAGTDA